MTILIEPWLAAYFDDVFARRAEAIDVQRIAVRYADGSEPQRSCCHPNVDRWAEENPTSRAVRGWAISAVAGDSLVLDAHSIVRLEDGSLIDITLRAESQRAPFIMHVGTESDFLAARSVRNQMIWPLPR